MPQTCGRSCADVYDHLARNLDSIDVQRELLTAGVEIYMSVITNRTNNVMKALTVLGTVTYGARHFQLLWDEPEAPAGGRMAACNRSGRSPYGGNDGAAALAVAEVRLVLEAYIPMARIGCVVGAEEPASGSTVTATIEPGSTVPRCR